MQILKFDNTLTTILIALGVGLMFAVFLQVNFGLLPLNKIKPALFKIEMVMRRTMGPIPTGSPTTCNRDK